MDTQPTPSHTNSNTFLFVTSKALERACYYGLRALLVLYMTGEVLQLESEKAFSIYTWLTSLSIVLMILGAVLGDLLMGNKTAALVGGVIQALGAFALCVPTTVSLYLAIGLIALGSGLYGPNLFSLFGKGLRIKDRTMDAGMTIFYTAVSLGAAIGAFLIGYLGEFKYIYGFGTAGLLMLISTVVLFFSRKQEEVKSQTEQKFSGRAVTIVLLAILISGLFWLLYDIAGRDSWRIGYELGEASGGFSKSLITGASSTAVVIFGILLSIVWFFTRLDRFLKVGIGFVLMAVAFFILLAIGFNYSTGAIIIFLLASCLMAIGELLVAPTLYSLITRYSNPKYLAIVFALMTLPGMLLIYIYGYLSSYFYGGTGLGLFYDQVNLGLKIAGGALLLFGIMIITMSLIVKPGSSQEGTA